MEQFETIASIANRLGKANGNTWYWINKLGIEKVGVAPGGKNREMFLYPAGTADKVQQAVDESRARMTRNKQLRERNPVVETSDSGNATEGSAAALWLEDVDRMLRDIQAELSSLREVQEAVQRDLARVAKVWLYEDK